MGSQRRLGVPSALVVLATLPACGGTEEVSRAEPDPDEVLEPLVDPGSAPPDCSEDDGYDVLLIEDWEAGAGTGWYSNNEYCQICNDVQNEIDEVSRPASCLAGGSPQSPESTGCNPSLSGATAELRRAALDDLKASAEQILPGGDYDDDEVITELAALFRSCDLESAEPDECREERTRAECLEADEPFECEAEALFFELAPLVKEQLGKADELRALYAECRAVGLDRDVVAETLTTREPLTFPRVGCDATQSPPAFAKPLPAEEIPGGRCGSRFGVHIELHRWLHRDGTTGRQFSASEPFDASDYDGVSFWMRSVPGSRNQFRVSVPESSTDEHSLVDGEPVCTFINPKEYTDNACDKFGRYFFTTSDWQFITVPFDEMRQNGFGKQAPFFNIGEILGLSFDYKQGQWDFWIDDIGFYRKK